MSTTREHTFVNAPPLGAPDPDGLHRREHVSPFFLNDDAEAQESIIKHLLVPTPKVTSIRNIYTNMPADACLPFSRRGLIEIHPINNSSLWRRAAAHLINAFIKKDSNNL